MNAVQENYRCFLLELHGSHKCNVWAKYRIF